MDYLQPESFFTMDPVIKQQWLDDLRSGNIKQAKGKLHMVDGSMCCLGVLSKRAAEAGAVVQVSISQSFAGDPREYYEYDRMTGGLSARICKWSGLDQDGRMTAQGLLPFRDSEGRQVYLDELNDGGFTFNQIADLIECFY